MKSFTGISVSLAVVGILLTLEAANGSFVPLTDGCDVNCRGGENCYSSLAANDMSCSAFGGTTCGDETCEKRTNEGGGEYYHCDRYYLQTQEYSGWKSTINSGLETGLSQDITATFYCSKRTNCKFGSFCAEATNEGVVTWHCINDGASFLTDQETNHLAGGSSCP